MIIQTTPTEPGRRGAQLVANYRASGKTRAAYCQEAGISISTLGYHQRRVREFEQTQLVPVKVTDPSLIGSFEGIETVAVLLRNGRRVELGWRGGESGLNHLLSLLEGE